MTLLELYRLLDQEELLEQTQHLPSKLGNVCVSGCDCDSRHAANGHIFVCKGAAFKDAYLADALAAGCVAYMCSSSLADHLDSTFPRAPQFVVSDLRRAMALVSAESWGHPDRSIQTLGITGTKGKSTVACMVQAILDSGYAQAQTALIGSIETFDGIERAESVNTTPEAPDLWRHIRNAADSGLNSLVMEVSSQALKYDRVLGLSLDSACFLNIGKDHISPVEHPDFEDYFASKLKIFEHARTAVINLDSDELERITQAASQCERCLYFSATTPQTVCGERTLHADIWADDVRSSLGSVSFIAHTPAWTERIHINMPGLFNVDNALAAIALSLCAGATKQQICDGLAKVRVPGRMELITTSNPKLVAIVDYAHNKLSYQKFFLSISKEFAGRAIVAVLGAPGGKAYERRQELPQEASRWANYLIYTEEDPAHESVADICAQLAAATPQDQAFEIVVERPKAIERAVDVALTYPQGAVVCLLAKGEETRQHVGDRFVPCETDASIFKRAIAKHESGEQS